MWLERNNVLSAPVLEHVFQPQENSLDMSKTKYLRQVCKCFAWLFASGSHKAWLIYLWLPCYGVQVIDQVALLTE